MPPTKSQSETFLNPRSRSNNNKNGETSRKRSRTDLENEETNSNNPTIIVEDTINELNEAESTRTIVPNTPESNSSNPSKDTQHLAKLLDRLTDKKTRYHSHISFLTKCINESIIPNGLKVELEPTIGNHDKQFLNTWHEKCKKFSLEMMQDIISFSEKTADTVEKERKTIEQRLKSSVNTNEEFNQLKKSIDETQDKNEKSLNIRKTKKINQLKYHPEKSLNSTKTTNQQNQQPRRTYADMARSKSNINHTPKHSRSKSNNRYQHQKPINKTNSNINQVQPRQKQIQQLEAQINALKAADKEEHQPKNCHSAPPRGATINHTDITPTDVLEFINTAIGKLNEFAEIFDKKNNMPQTRQGTW